MKIQSILLLCFTFYQSSNALSDINLQPRILEDLINTSIECVRDTLIEGIPDLGLPSFNPLQLRNLTLDLDKLNSDYFSGQMWLDGECDNIVKYEITSLKGDLGLIPPTYTVNFSMHYDDVTCWGDYRVNVTVLNSNIYGAGSISSGVVNLDLGGHVKAVIGNGGVSLKEFDAPVTIEAYKLLITGLMNDEELSKQISEQISEIVPTIINENPELFSEIIGPILVVLFNALVNDEIGVGIIKQMVQICILDVISPP